jgi:hypothetical protein
MLPATARRGGEAADVVLHELWPLAGRTRVRAADACLTAFTALTAFTLGWSVLQRLTLRFAIVLGVLAALSGLFAITTDRPKRLVNPFRTPRGRSNVAVLLTFGLAFGLIVGLAYYAGAWRRYAVFLLCSRCRLPFRLGLFLEWAVTAGLMRYSGPAYKYRHRELQHWLRQHPQPPAVP